VYQAQDQEVEGGSFNFPLAETTLRRFGAVADCGGRSTDRDLAQCDDMVRQRQPQQVIDCEICSTFV
jgi:hypothetical protein